jgi:hypothetical protein
MDPCRRINIVDGVVNIFGFLLWQKNVQKLISSVILRVPVSILDAV